MSHLATPAAVWIRPHVEPLLSELVQVIQDAASHSGYSQEELSSVMISQRESLLEISMTLEVAGLRSASICLSKAAEVIQTRVKPEMELNDPDLVKVVEVVLWAVFHTGNLVESQSLGNMDDPAYSQRIMLALSELSGNNPVNQWDLFAPLLAPGIDRPDSDTPHMFGEKEVSRLNGSDLASEASWVLSRLTVGLASLPSLSVFFPGLSVELPRLTQQVQLATNTPSPDEGTQDFLLSTIRRALYGLACALRAMADEESSASLLPALPGWPTPLQDLVQAYDLPRALPNAKARIGAGKIMSGLNLSVVQATTAATSEALLSMVQRVQSGENIPADLASAVVSSLDFMGLQSTARDVAKLMTSTQQRGVLDKMTELASSLEEKTLHALTTSAPVFSSNSDQLLIEGAMEKLSSVKAEIQSGLEEISEDEELPSHFIRTQDGVLARVEEDFKGLGLSVPAKYIEQLRLWLVSLASVETVPIEKISEWAQAYACVEYSIDALRVGHRGAAEILFKARPLLISSGFDPQPGCELKAPAYILDRADEQPHVHEDVAHQLDGTTQSEITSPSPVIVPTHQAQVELALEMDKEGKSEESSKVDPQVAELAARDDLPPHIRALLEKSLPQQSDTDTEAETETETETEADTDTDTEAETETETETETEQGRELEAPAVRILQEELPEKSQINLVDPASGLESTLESDAQSSLPVKSNEEELTEFSESPRDQESSDVPTLGLDDYEFDRISPPAPEHEAGLDSVIPPASQEVSPSYDQTEFLPEQNQPDHLTHDNDVSEQVLESESKPVQPEQIERFDIPELTFEIDQEVLPEATQDIAIENFEIPDLSLSSEYDEDVSPPVVLNPTLIVPFDAPATVSLDGDMQEIFSEEVSEELASLLEWIPALFEAVPNPDIIYNVRKSFHTIKGSGKMVGAASLGEMAWSVESVLNKVMDNRRPLSECVIELVLHAQKMIEQYQLALSGKPACWDISTMVEWASRLEQGQEVSSPFPSSIKWEEIAETLTSESRPTQESDLTEHGDTSFHAIDIPTVDVDTTPVPDESLPILEIVPPVSDLPEELVHDQGQEAGVGEISSAQSLDASQGEGVLTLPTNHEDLVEIEHISGQDLDAPWTSTSSKIDVQDEGQKPEQTTPSELTSSTIPATQWELTDDVPLVESSPVVQDISPDLAAKISELALTPFEDEPNFSPETEATPSFIPEEEQAETSEEKIPEQQTTVSEQKDVQLPLPEPKAQEQIPFSEVKEVLPVPTEPTEPMRPRPLTQDALLQGTDWKVLLSHVQDQSIAIRAALDNNDQTSAKECIDRQIVALDRLGDLVLAIERSGNLASARLKSLSARKSIASQTLPLIHNTHSSEPVSHATGQDITVSTPGHNEDVVKDSDVNKDESGKDKVAKKSKPVKKVKTDKPSEPVAVIETSDAGKLSLWRKFVAVLTKKR